MHPTNDSRTRRAMALARRWLSLIIGLVLLALTLGDVIQVHQGEIMRSLNPAAYSRVAGPDQVSLPQAIDSVAGHHPDEIPASATLVDNVIEVRTQRSTYTVDPTTGGEIGRVSASPQWLAALDNLHRCLLSCQGPGHMSWMSQEIPHTRWPTAQRNLTVGDLVGVTLGLVLLVLTVSGMRVWWPLQHRRRGALSARWRTRRLSRDTDLLKAAGLVSLPLLFLWGYSASVLDLHPAGQESFGAAAGARPLRSEQTTGAQHGQRSSQQSGRQASQQASQHSEDIGPHRAVAAAQEAHPGRPVALFLPEEEDPSPTYTVWLSQGADATHSRAAGNVAVSVDADTGRTTIPESVHRIPNARAG